MQKRPLVVPFCLCFPSSVKNKAPNFSRAHDGSAEDTALCDQVTEFWPTAGEWSSVLNIAGLLWRMCLCLLILWLPLSWWSECRGPCLCGAGQHPWDGRKTKQKEPGSPWHFIAIRPALVCGREMKCCFVSALYPGVTSYSRLSYLLTETVSGLLRSSWRHPVWTHCWILPGIFHAWTNMYIHTCMHIYTHMHTDICIYSPLSFFI